MSCDDISDERLVAYLNSDGSVDASLVAHVDGCSGCSDRLKHLATPAPSWLPGTVLAYPCAGLPEDLPDIPGYDVLEAIGSGSTGVVFKARHQELNRLVALKVFPELILRGPEARERMYREAQAQARLSHPGIVQVYEVSTTTRPAYLALEYCEGGSLSKRIGGNPVPPRKAARLVMALAEAIEVAHAQGVLHRDLKPGNVLLTADGTPKVGDFGVAKLLGGDGEQTASSQLPGTPCYMAPEVAHGDRAAVGTATDVYGLGAILYQLLTGQPPFRGATLAETLDQVRGQEPTAPRRINAHVPPDLEAICLHCLRKKPTARYPSAADMAADLGRFLGGKPVQAQPGSSATRRQRRRRTVVRAVLLVVLAAGTALLPFRHTPVGRDVSPPSVEDAEAALHLAVALRPALADPQQFPWNGMTPADRERYRERLTRAVANSPAADHDRAIICFALGSLHAGVGCFAAAREPLETAVRIWQGVEKSARPGEEQQLTLSTAYRLLAEIHGHAGPHEAVRWVRRAEVILEVLVNGSPNPLYRYHLAMTLVESTRYIKAATRSGGLVERSTQRIMGDGRDLAYRHLDRSRQLLEQLAAQHPEKDVYRLGMMRQEVALADFLEWTSPHDWRGAAPVWEAALRSYRGLSALEADRPDIRLEWAEVVLRQARSKRDRLPSAVLLRRLQDVGRNLEREVQLDPTNKLLPEHLTRCQQYLVECFALWLDPRLNDRLNVELPPVGLRLLNVLHKCYVMAGNPLLHANLAGLCEQLIVVTENGKAWSEAPLLLFRLGEILEETLLRLPAEAFPTQELLGFYSQMTAYLLDHSDFPLALRAARRAAACFRRAADHSSGAAVKRAELAEWAEPLCYHMRRAGAQDEAMQTAELARQVYEDLLRAEPNHSDWAIGLCDSWMQIAKNHWQLHQLGAVQSACARALDTLRPWAERWPENGAVRQKLADAYHRLGRCLNDQCRWTEAAACYREMVRLVQDNAVLLKRAAKDLGELAAETEKYACHPAYPGPEEVRRYRAWQASWLRRVDELGLHGDAGARERR